VVWIYLAKNWVRLCAVVNAVMNLLAHTVQYCAVVNAVMNLKGTYGAVVCCCDRGYEPSGCPKYV
jgi:hypothetical protein